MLSNFNALSIYEIEEMKPLFDQILQTNSPIAIDMKSIEKIDMVGIQLLISSVKSAQLLNKEIRFIHLNETLLEHINACNCTKALGL